jgi:hypothetical protein
MEIYYKLKQGSKDTCEYDSTCIPFCIEYRQGISMEITKRPLRKRVEDIIPELLDFCTLSIICYSEKLEDTTFRKLISSLPQVKGRHLLRWVPYKELTSIIIFRVTIFLGKRG